MTAPTVIDVSTTTVDGTYTNGEVIAIAVQCSAAVDVVGTPQLLLQFDAYTLLINYTSGTGTDTIVFTLTAGPADTTEHLSYVSAMSLSLNGGTIKNAALQNLVLTLPTPGAVHSLSANSHITLEPVIPVSATLAARAQLSPLRNLNLGLGL